MKKLILFVLAATFAIALATSGGFPVSHDISQIEQQDALTYWTKERMASAVPLEYVYKGNGRFEMVTNFTTTPDVGVKQTGYVPDGSYQQMPYKPTGKVFFTLNGGNYVCSASASGNNAVLTAGHCVSDGKGTWASNWIFVPGYNNGAEPHGRWAAYTLTTFKEWHNGGSFGRDVAFAMVSPKQGRSISQTVGTVQVTSCGMGNTVKALGYPVAKYGGNKMVQADNSISQRDTRQNPPTNGIVTDMTGGCSGGPWFSGTRACGVNSYLYQGRAMIYSPVFDSAVVNLRNEALRK